uniref:TLC domain-containing protein 3A isoform X2 n=1 Tax=Geotrypetes seraphini TaxID=260995 RepID=A0A6P8PTT1_GEOSA|nr:TLC domain-containing protein 3A isoform X2 [Geotrypetes seraphini]
MLHVLGLGALFFPGLFLLARRCARRALPGWTMADRSLVGTRFVSSVQAVLATVSGLIIVSSCRDALVGHRISVVFNSIHDLRHLRHVSVSLVQKLREGEYGWKEARHESSQKFCAEGFPDVRASHGNTHHSCAHWPVLSQRSRRFFRGLSLGGRIEYTICIIGQSSDPAKAAAYALAQGERWLHFTDLLPLPHPLVPVHVLCLWETVWNSFVQGAVPHPSALQCGQCFHSGTTALLVLPHMP